MQEYTSVNQDPILAQKVLGYLASWTTRQTNQLQQEQEKESLIYPEPEDDEQEEGQKSEDKVNLRHFRKLSNEDEDDQDFVELIKEIPLPTEDLLRDQMQLNRLVEPKTIKDLIEDNLNANQEETDFKKEIPDKVFETINKLQYHWTYETDEDKQQNMDDVENLLITIFDASQVVNTDKFKDGYLKDFENLRKYPIKQKLIANKI